MEIVQDYRHTEAWEGLCDSKELQRNIPLVSYVQTLRKNDTPTIEQHLIKEHAGFRPGKSCTSQLLNLTQHIEDGYQESMITGTAFIDRSAAYNTVSHILLIQKLFNITQDSTLCRVIQNLLSNIRFYVELNNERSRSRLQKNGLPQGSVLSPTLFNIHTNDKPVHDGTRSFIYADDLCITAQFPTFSQLESTIEEALGELTAVPQLLLSTHSHDPC